MSEPTWKIAERRFARRLGTERQPLSGIRGGRTHSDSQHPSVYAEHKHTRNPPAAVTLLEKTRKLAKREGKMPLVAYHRAGTQQVAVVLDSRDFFALWDILRDLAAWKPLVDTTLGKGTTTDVVGASGIGADLIQRARAIVTKREA